MNSIMTFLLAVILIGILIKSIQIVIVLFINYKKNKDMILKSSELLDKYIAIISNESEPKRRTKKIKSWQKEVNEWKDKNIPT
ncbi:hypothetical protein [uncultured Shewanella sp.]|uniref:hypothetical protein n=1 Tax=uncultured Shewanella sp. TaxID=173975 RepID=UPI0026373E65|nr:hypothetical protein [uncultured Shewanella sp.]